MLKAYKPIQPEHKIFGVQKLIEFLVLEVWCKADTGNFYDKFNDDLKQVYDKTSSKWFKEEIENIYEVTKKLDDDEKKVLSELFTENNKIKHLCASPNDKKDISLLNDGLKETIIPFFKDLYKQLLTLSPIKEKFGTKKEYYDELITFNDFTFCPCCGFGQIKTIYDKGHSAYDHYLSQKHYPFSAVNFNNLIPLCDNCNSSHKGETDILERGKKVFYPINSNHPSIKVEVEISKDSFKEIIIKRKGIDKLDEKHISVGFNLNNEETESWNTIFGIKDSYFGQIALNRGSWLQDVKNKYEKDKKGLIIIRLMMLLMIL